MVFRVASSSDESFSSVRIQEFLIVSLEDQVCLDSIPGWEPRLLEANGHSDNISPPLLPAEKTALASAPVTHPKAVNEECTIVNGGLVDAVKRKIFASHLVTKAPRSRIPGQSLSVQHQSLESEAVSRADETSTSKRPRSLPDFGSYHATGEHCVDSCVPSDGKEAAAKEDRRLKSLVSTFRGNLQKDSPISRSLNNISDVQNRASSFRSRPAAAPTSAVTNLRNRSAQHCSPSPDATTSGGKRSTPSNKKSCVRRLDMDDRSTVSQSAGSEAENGRHSLVHKETAGVGSCEQASANSSPKRRQLGSFAKTSKNNARKTVKSIRDPQTPPGNAISKSVAPNRAQETPASSNNSAVSQQYRLGPDTQRALMSDFGEDSLCVSVKLSEHQRASKTVETGIEEALEVAMDDDNTDVSEELIPGSQHSRNEGHLQREKNVQQDQLEGPQTAESECHHFERLGTVLSALRQGSPDNPTPRGLRFTAPQVKSMCAVLNRLYSL